MPKSTILRVCVVALTHPQHTAVDPQVLKLLRGRQSNNYDVTKDGIIYGNSPDEWHPFEDNKTVLDYLRDVGFTDSSLSRFVASSDKIDDLNTLLTEVDLYIFDPLFLTLSGSYPQLVGQLQGAIRSGNKPFCVLVPERLPQKASEKLSNICETKLPLLKFAYESGSFCEWKAESSVRLKAFLSRLYRQVKELPQQETLDAFAKMLISAGIPSISLNESPKLSGN